MNKRPLKRGPKPLVLTELEKKEIRVTIRGDGEDYERLLGIMEFHRPKLYRLMRAYLNTDLRMDAAEFLGLPIRNFYLKLRRGRVWMHQAILYGQKHLKKEQRKNRDVD